MKPRIPVTILMLTLLSLKLVSQPTVTNVTIAGQFTVGATLTASYIVENAAGDTLYTWYEVTPADTIAVGADENSLVIPASSESKRLLLKVSISESGVTTDSAFSALSPIVVENTPPEASNVVVTGSLNVNDVLLGNYEYSDPDGDQEGSSLFRWWISDDASGFPATQIAGETTRTYKIRLADQGRYIWFDVTPVAKSGSTPGNTSQSDVRGAVNSAPEATTVAITGDPLLGSTLMGSYTYSDADGDNEGSSLYKWYRNGTVITGANSTEYTLTLDDLGFQIRFEVTPMAATGFPDMGNPAMSSPTAVITDPSPGVPMASNVCIDGIRAAGATLTGKYTFYDDKHNEQNSLLEWYVDGSLEGTGLTYTLDASETDAEIVFAVTPRNNRGITGTKVESSGLAIITLTSDEFSIADPPVTLMATPPGGIFYGPGVSDGMFYPEIAGEGGPYDINYSVNVSSCVQSASASVSVNSVTLYFESFRNVYCHDGGHDTIYVANVPPEGINRQFRLTNGDALVDYLSDTAIIIDPSKMRPGIQKDTLFFSYAIGASIYPVSRPFIIDSVGTDLAFTGLDEGYCAGGDRRFITVSGLFPGGGSGSWSGMLVSDPSSASSFIDPQMGTAGNSYLLEYQYTSPLGCSSPVISETIEIYPLPDPDFLIDATYNIETPVIALTPDTPGGTFIGPGVFASQFYPSIAGQGVHQIGYYITDSNGCSANLQKTTTVRKAQGIFEGIDGVVCYDDVEFDVTVSGLPAGITITGFESISDGFTWTTGTAAGKYNVPAAGAGIDSLRFSYLWDGVPYMLHKQVFIDSTGTITIIGLKDDYCEYEGTTLLRVFVENSTGTGNFSFSEPVAGFANYGTTADLDPSNIPARALHYTVTYTHESTVNQSGCLTTHSRDIFINPTPEVVIDNDRVTANIDESPIVLTGTPVTGAFSGRGVYRQDDGDYVFNPAVAGMGKSYYTLSHVDDKGCFASVTDSITVVGPTGSIEGLRPSNQYCYDGTTDTLRYESSEPYLAGNFGGEGIDNIAPGQATFKPSLAGPGTHNIWFEYIDLWFTYFRITATLNVDSIGVVTIENLPAASVWCNNDPMLQLFTSHDGGIFTGPVTGNSFDPSKGVGDTEVGYTWIRESTGCSGSVTIPVTINPAPQTEFTVADVCIRHPNDTTEFINSTSSDDPIGSWKWEFRDGGGFVLSDLFEPGYLYTAGGLHQITLTATTVNGCADTEMKTIDLGVKPDADFYWLNECFHAEDSVHLFDNTLTGSHVTARSWNFFDGDSPLTDTNPRYPKTSEGYIPVEYIVYTNYQNCYDTVRKDIFIRPTIVLTGDDYFENFENGPGGWIADSEGRNSWSFGTPDRPVINSAVSGDNAWYTAFNIDGQLPENSSVSSPCFDFTGVERPMISVSMWHRFDRDRDGAAIQYKIGDSTPWEYLGTIDDGINWYNSTFIKGRPGGDQIGWTTTLAQGPDTTWKEVRRRLDELAGERDVKFRIAYGSDGTPQENEGVAFDDIHIGVRTRNVLMEHFTNNSSMQVATANSTVNSLANSMYDDVININYHTNFPGADQLYLDIPSDMSARVLLYGLTKVPSTIIDGGTQAHAFAGTFNWAGTADHSDMLNKRSLINPSFEIDLDPVIAGGMLVVNGSIRATTPVEAANLTLYIAVTSREITSLTAPNGEEVFYNTLRRMLPDAGGVRLPSIWSSGQSADIAEYTWRLQKLYDSRDIEIIAFIQDNATRIIYQAARSEIKDISVGIEYAGPKEAEFKLYPNPSAGTITLSFPEPLPDMTRIEVTDFRGTVLRRWQAGPGSEIFTVADHGLANGVYMVRIITGTRPAGIRRLVVAGR